VGVVQLRFGPWLYASLLALGMTLSQKGLTHPPPPWFPFECRHIKSVSSPYSCIQASCPVSSHLTFSLVSPPLLIYNVTREDFIFNPPLGVLYHYSDESRLLFLFLMTLKADLASNVQPASVFWNMTLISSFQCLVPSPTPYFPRPPNGLYFSLDILPMSLPVSWYLYMPVPSSEPPSKSVA